MGASPRTRDVKNLDELLAAAKPDHALPAQCYTDPEIYAQVLQKLFMRSWQYAGHESQLPHKGDYLTLTIAEQDLVLIRQPDESIACFYNVCQHRGHILLQGEGNVGSMTCPYHAWTYNLNGTLRGAPGAHRMAHFAKAEICLTSVRLENFCGFIFVNLDNDAAAMDETYPGVREAITAHCPEAASIKFADAHHSHEYCNWLIAVENYNECYHCAHIHPQFSKGVVDPESYQILPFGGGACLNHRAHAASGEGAWYDTSKGDYASFYLFPSFSLQIYPSTVVNSYHWQPCGVDDTIVTRGWFSKDGTVDEDLRKIITLDAETTFVEDLQLVKNVQRGMTMNGYRPGPLILDPEQKINSEHPIQSLHQWFKQAMMQ